MQPIEIMGRTPTLSRTLVVAVVGHVGAIAWLAAVPSATRAPAVATPGVIVEVDVSAVDPSTAAIPTANATPNATATSTSNTTPTSNANTTPTPTPRPERAALAIAETAGQTTLRSSEGPPEGAPDGNGPPAGPALTLEQLGLSGPNRFLGETGAPVHAERDAPSPGSATGHGAVESVKAALRAHDVALGLGSDGPVIAALETATTESDAPLNGQATFVAWADARGGITGIDVVAVSSDMPAWRKVAAVTLGAMKGKTVRVPAGAKGVAMRIQLDSHLALPSGADPGVSVSVLGIPVKPGDGPNSTHVGVLEGPTVVSVAGDLSDIGAHPRRVVHAHVTREQVL